VIAVPSPLGDVVDRLTILELKVERANDAVARERASALHAALSAAWVAAGLPPWRTLPERAPLAEVNAELWETEDTLRRHERTADFGPDFVRHARAVYRLNDRRAALKAQIDRRLDSAFQEPKLYT
jgi:hypothetical protein